jgi:hypothetical protein
MSSVINTIDLVEVGEYNHDNYIDELESTDDGLNELLGDIQKPKTIDERVAEALADVGVKRKKTGGRPKKEKNVVTVEVVDGVIYESINGGEPTVKDIDDVKVKRPRTEAQKAATERMLKARDEKFKQQRLDKAQQTKKAKKTREDNIVKTAISIRKKQLKEEAYLKELEGDDNITMEEINELRAMKLKKKSLPSKEPKPYESVTTEQSTTYKFV